MGSCDVCGEKLGIFGRFRYAEGYICKSCYQKASRQFSETVAQKCFREVQELCKTDSSTEKVQDFEITGRIGNYVLLDEKNRKICILNNRMTGKNIGQPKIYAAEEIVSCEICSEPAFTKEDLERKVWRKEDGCIQSLKVCIRLVEEKKPVDILLISSGARIKSYAFRRSYHFAKRIEEGVIKVLEGV